MTLRLLLAAAIAAGPIAVTPAFAQGVAKPEMSETKTQKTAKAKKNNRAPRSPGQTKANDTMTGSPYSTQKDEMTR